MLEIRGLSVDGPQRPLLSVERLSVAAGESVALIGPNGAGKSTLLKTIAGEQRAYGHIALHGRPIDDWPMRERARHVGVLPQASHLAFPFSAAEVVSLGLMPLAVSRSDGERLVQQAMADADCQHLAGRNFMALSGGEKQRVQLARVLVQLQQAKQAPLLLLDEPVSAQDLGQQHGLLAMASGLCRERGFTVMAVLHDLNQALRYSQRCLVLQGGEVLADGAPDAVLSEDFVSSVWHYRPQRLASRLGDVLV